jgi:hypothetical protein
MVGWIILILLPRKWPKLNIVPSLLIPIILSLGYTIIIGMSFFSPGSEGNFSSLAGVQLLFTSPAAALGGWIHYLAFDLLIGGVVARKADQIGLSRLIQAPILFATFMFGPFGYLLFKIVEGLMTLTRK